MERDLKPWACYMTVKLPLEHPLVKDTTHSDCALEGVFLGWHDTTPSCWMYRVKEQCILKVQDVVFKHSHEDPFLDPTCIITPGTLTADQ
eukprot:720989-Rhodomonas_salina.1